MTYALNAQCTLSLQTPRAPRGRARSRHTVQCGPAHLWAPGVLRSVSVVGCVANKGARAGAAPALAKNATTTTRHTIGFHAPRYTLYMHICPYTKHTRLGTHACNGEWPPVRYCRACSDCSAEQGFTPRRWTYTFVAGGFGCQARSCPRRSCGATGRALACSQHSGGARGEGGAGVRRMSGE